MAGSKRVFIVAARDKGPTPLETYRQELVELVHKSQDSFESQLAYLAGGAIVVSMALVADIIPLASAKCKIVLYASWFFLTACLIINFLSHIYSKRYHNNTIIEIDSRKYRPKNAQDRNRKINIWNGFTLACFIPGLLTLFIFVILNTLPMAKQSKPQQTKQAPPPDQTKGRTSTNPPGTKQNEPYKGGRQSTNPPKNKE